MTKSFNILTDPITPKIIFAFRKSLEYSQSRFGVELAIANGFMISYTRGFISNLENGKQKITPKVETGIRNMFKLFVNSDDATPFIGDHIQYKPDKVSYGSLYTGHSKACKWDDCGNSYIPTSPNQKQCPECKRRRS